MRREQELTRRLATARLAVDQIGLEVFTYDVDARSARYELARDVLDRVGAPAADFLSVPPGSPACPDFPATLLSSGVVAPDFADAVADVFRSLESDEPRAVYEWKTADVGGRYAWVRLSLVAMQAEESSGRRAVGILEDISREKETLLNYLNETRFYQSMLSEKDAYAQLDVTEDRLIRVGGMWNLYNPCPFCSKASWSADKFFLWKNLNSALEQEFLNKNKLVHWRGRKALLASAIDISNDKSMVDSLENGATESHSIISGIQRMSEAHDLESAMRSGLETVGSFFLADAVRLWECRDPAEGYRCAHIWHKSRSGTGLFPSEEDRRIVSAWLRDREWGRPIMIEHREVMLCYSIDNQRWRNCVTAKPSWAACASKTSPAIFRTWPFWNHSAAFWSASGKKRRLMESILYAGSHDAWTGLYSRSSYEKYLRDYDANAVSSLGVMTANLNNLKGINSTRGFQTGDHYIKKFASILRHVFLDRGLLFRINGDEFVALAEDMPLEDWDGKVAEVGSRVEEFGHFSASSRLGQCGKGRGPAAGTGGPVHEGGKMALRFGQGRRGQRAPGRAARIARFVGKARI